MAQTMQLGGLPARIDPPPAVRAGGEVIVPGGRTVIGTDEPWAYDNERPAHEVELAPYRIDRALATNRDYIAFMADGGYARRELWSDEGWAWRDSESAAAPLYWHREGEEWLRTRFGVVEPVPGGEPVVHVCFWEAEAFARWAGKRLPTEAEWELAARGGRVGANFPWGDELEPGGEQRMNVWQGRFPNHNTLADGYLGTCPVDAFAPNGYGLYNATGNVWEWTADWFDATYRTRDRRTDPVGPPTGTHRVQKGGSYLCHQSYCRRYRVSARQGNEPESSTGNPGFRCAADIASPRVP
jgi:ergothioneine biosynthesis protein EgtB